MTIILSQNLLHKCISVGVKKLSTFPSHIYSYIIIILIWIVVYKFYYPTVYMCLKGKLFPFTFLACGL